MLGILRGNLHSASTETKTDAYITTLNIVSQHGTLIRKGMSRKSKWSNAELAVLHLTDTTTPVA